MQGKTVVVTGGTSGIGEVAARKLAEMGARIVLIARDKSRAEATLARLRKIGPGLAHCAHLADLTQFAEMKRVAGQIAVEEPRIDVQSITRALSLAPGDLPLMALSAHSLSITWLTS